MRVKHEYDKWYKRAHWTSLRTLVLARDPVCMMCQEKASTVADHKIHHRGNWTLFCDLENLWGLCKDCNAKKSATEGDWLGNPVKTGTTSTNAPTVTGDGGRQFTSSSIAPAKLDAALDFDVDELLSGL